MATTMSGETNKRKGLFRRILLMLVLIGFLGQMLTPQPAFARWCGSPVCPGDTVIDAKKIAAAEERMAEWGVKIAEYMEIITGFLNLGKLFQAMSDLFGDDIDKLAAFKEAQAFIRGEKQAEYENFRTEADLAIKLAGADAQIAEKAVRRDQKNDLLCYTLAARETAPAMKAYAGILSEWVMRGFTSDRTGDGPAYAARDRAMTCGTLNKNDPKTGNSADSPGNCGAGGEVTLAGGQKVSMADAGFTVLSLSPGRAVLMMPPLVEKEVMMPSGVKMKVSIAQAEAGNAQQQLWIAARDVCYRMMGPRPNPPVAEAAESDSGRKAAATFAKCMALQTPFMKVCADRLAYITRPNCKDPKFKAFCEASQTTCKAAIAHGLQLPPSFEDCKNGLNPYEAEYISNYMCATGIRATNMAANGQPGAEQPKNDEKCNESRLKWERRLAADDALFIEATKGAQAVRSCWADMQ